MSSNRLALAVKSFGAAAIVLAHHPKLAFDVMLIILRFLRVGGSYWIIPQQIKSRWGCNTIGPRADGNDLWEWVLKTGMKRMTVLPADSDERRAVEAKFPLLGIQRLTPTGVTLVGRISYRVGAPDFKCMKCDMCSKCTEHNRCSKCIKCTDCKHYNWVNEKAQVMSLRIVFIPDQLLEKIFWEVEIKDSDPYSYDLSDGGWTRIRKDKNSPWIYIR